MKGIQALKSPKVNKINTCPHCENKNVEIVMKKDKGVINFSVTCSTNKGGCGASGGFRRTKTEAINAWNWKNKKGKNKKTDSNKVPHRSLDNFLKMTVEGKTIYPLTRKQALEYWEINNACKIYKICKPDSLVLIKDISDIFNFTGQLFGYEYSK